MDAMHMVLALGLLAGAAGVVVLLLQRGALVARAAVAEEAARAATAGWESAESQLTASRQAIQQAEARVAEAQQEAAALAERAASLAEARDQDRREAAAALRDAVDAERRLHAQELDAAERVHAERVAAAQLAREQIEAKLREFDAKLQQAFGKLASDALAKSSTQFLELAAERLGAKQNEATADMDKRREAVERLIKPIEETLRKTDDKLAAIERERGTAYAGLAEQVRAMQQEGVQLRAETGKLVKALREPQVRGRYGEIQLKRVAELAGMRAYCDFEEQHATVGDDGRLLKPDMIVRLPNGRELVVDAKANLKPYLDAMEATDPLVIDACLQRFADGVAEQAKNLARKGYFAGYAGSPEFVVMFVPGDQFVDAALAKRPDLLDFAASHGVILTSPGSLIAMLRAVAVGFTERRLSEEAGAIRDLVRELHKRFATALEHLGDLGGSLRRSVEQWNRFLGSVESMLLPQLRRIEDSGVKSDKPLPELKVISIEPRLLWTDDGKPAAGK